MKEMKFPSMNEQEMLNAFSGFSAESAIGRAINAWLDRELEISMTHAATRNLDNANAHFNRGRLAMVIDLKDQFNSILLQNKKQT